MSEEMKSIVMEGLKDLVTSEEFKTIIAENIVKNSEAYYFFLYLKLIF